MAMALEPYDGALRGGNAWGAGRVPVSGGEGAVRGPPRIELEPVAWATQPMFWVLCDGAVVGTVLPLPDHAIAEGTTLWLASACEEMGGA